VLVAVDDGGSDLLGHTLEEGFNLTQTKLSGVAVEIGDVLVDDRVGFEVATSVDDLRRGGLGVRNAGVQQAPRRLGEARADGGFVSSRKIALHDEHVIKDFVGLRQEFDNRCHSVPIIHSLGPVSVS